MIKNLFFFLTFLMQPFSLYTMQSQHEKILSWYEQEKQQRENDKQFFKALFYFDSQPWIQDALLRACHGLRDLTEKEEQEIYEYPLHFLARLIESRRFMWANTRFSSRAVDLFQWHFHLDKEKGVWKFTAPDYFPQGHDITIEPFLGLDLLK